MMKDKEYVKKLEGYVEELEDSIESFKEFQKYLFRRRNFIKKELKVLNRELSVRGKDCMKEERFNQLTFHNNQMSLLNEIVKKLQEKTGVEK